MRKDLQRMGSSVPSSITMKLLPLISKTVVIKPHPMILSVCNLFIGERSKPLSRVFNEQPRDIYGGVRTYVQNASCYFSKLKLRSQIIVRKYVTLAFDF